VTWTSTCLRHGDWVPRNATLRAFLTPHSLLLGETTHCEPHSFGRTRELSSSGFLRREQHAALHTEGRGVGCRRPCEPLSPNSLHHRKRRTRRASCTAIRSAACYRGGMLSLINAPQHLYLLHQHTATTLTRYRAHPPSLLTGAKTNAPLLYLLSDAVTKSARRVAYRVDGRGFAGVTNRTRSFANLQILPAWLKGCLFHGSFRLGRAGVRRMHFFAVLTNGALSARLQNFATRVIVTDCGLPPFYLQMPPGRDR